ncbi:DMT family transporter [Streptomyces sp. Ru73]|uniref:DMT family transporter n=1 Tax=Streptomyces sp. Ru73 TaxID=2080748 RepID=UPI00215644BE|nr:DMT family transporter [Streptomyces sp. Ru73]
MKATPETRATVVPEDRQHAAGTQTAAGLLVVAGAACLSASAMFVKLADINAGTAAFLRCAVALVPLIPMLVHEARRHGPLPGPLYRHAVSAGVFLGVDYVMWTVSILDIGAAISTVLINVQVIAFPVLARIFSGTPIPRRFLFTTPFMLAGIALAAGVLEHDGQAPHPVRGAVLGVAAGVAYAMYLYLTRLSGQRSPQHLVAPVCISTGSAALASGGIALLTTGLPLAIRPAAWGWIIALALLGQVAAWLFISKGSHRLAPNASAALLLLQPVMAIGFGLVVLGESPTVSQLAGCAVVIGAVWFANRAPRRHA